MNARAKLDRMPASAPAGGCGSSAVAADRFDAVRAHIRAVIQQQSIASIAVAVAQHGRILWEEGFGWADRERRVPATEHTMYSLASISKPLTATGLMRLVQAGKIDLEKPVNDYLGNVKLRARVGDARAATVRRVANHTSGLPPHRQFFHDDEPYSRPPMDETLRRYGNLVAAPGEQYEYSNLGYGVLDYIIERTSGRSYGEFMRREVFLPLGMTRTSVDIGPGLEAFAAPRYGADGQPIPLNESDHPGATAVYSSAHDLLRFGLFQLKARLRGQRAILSDTSIDEMQRRTTRKEELGGYGVGFFVNKRSGYRIVEHSGGMDEVSTLLQLFPTENLAMVVLSNSRSQLPFTTADRIAAALLPKWKTVPRESSPPPSPFVTPAELRGVWRGVLSTYVQEKPVELHFCPNGAARAKFGDEPLALIDHAHFADSVFSGDLQARIGTPDTERQEYMVRLSLRLRGDVLNGAARATGVAPPRVGNVLAHWIELKKQ